MALEYYFLMVFIVLVLGFVNKSYRRHKRKNLDTITFENVVQSNEKFVLYLRAFEDDGKSKELPTSLFTLNVQLPTFEEQMAKDFKHFKLIAIGRPHEELPELGANRLYVTDDLWKEQVAILIEKASAIIVKPSFTDGLNWELDTIINKGFLSKMIIFHLFKDSTDKALQQFYYTKFKEVMNDSFNLKLNTFSANAIYSYFQNDLTHCQVRRIKEIPLTSKLKDV